MKKRKVSLSLKYNNVLLYLEQTKKKYVNMKKIQIYY